MEEQSCRICLKPYESMTEIFNQLCKNSKLLEKFKFLSIIIEPSVGTPRFICELCKSKLIIACQFKREVLESEEKLKEKFLSNVSTTSDQEKVILSVASVKSVDLEEEEVIFEDIVEVYDIDQISDDTTNDIEKAIQKQNNSHSKKKKSVPIHLDDSIIREKIILNGKTIYRKKCPFCNTMQQNLKQHLLIHTGNKEHNCLVCHKKFAQYSNYRQHMRIHESPDPDTNQIKCEICNQTFTDSRSLKRHQVRHTGDRKYKCDICSKAFLYSHNLLCHKRSHENDRRYKCTYCEMAFITIGVLKRHIKNLHEKGKDENRKSRECKRVLSSDMTNDEIVFEIILENNGEEPEIVEKGAT